MLAAAVFALSALVGVVVGNRCYVCVPQSGTWREEAIQIFPDPLLCDHFNPRDKRFERECPPGYPGCLSYSDGTRIMRMCSNQPQIDDCKKANNVQYCFCSGDLCNGKTTSPPPPRPPPEDDPDLPEGSGAGGGGYIPAPVTTVLPPHGTTSGPSQSLAPLNRTLYPILFALAALVMFVT